MNTIRLTGLPRLRFAHTFGNESYHTTLPTLSNVIEITYVSQGTIQCEQNGHLFTSSMGDVTCNLFQSANHICADSYHEHHTVCFTVPFVPAQDIDEDALHLPQLGADRTSAQECRRLIDEIIRAHTQEADSDMKCAGLFLQLLAEISALNRQFPPAQTDGGYRHVQKAKKYILENLYRPILQREIAAYLNITPEHLCTVFKKFEGVPLMTYINRIKLERIHTLIHREKLPLYRAAELFGYNDPNYVSRLYRRLYGTGITKDDSIAAPLSSSE